MLAQEHKSAYLLCKALRERTPPLFISDSMAKQWLLKYFGQENLTKVHNAGQLETWYGARLRAEMPKTCEGGSALAAWLYKQLGVSADAKVCQKWLSTDYSSSGVLLTAAAVEQALGERLRLDQYRLRFSDEDVIGRESATFHRRPKDFA